MNIPNLYKARKILSFKECFALEKIHGSSAHLGWDGSAIKFFSGGVKHENFVKLFDTDALTVRFRGMGLDKMVIFGEAYGGKCQGMSKTYGPDLRFVAFEVKIVDCWLDVPNAAQVVDKMGLEFVHYNLIPTDQESLDRVLNDQSVQAIRNGMGGGHKREGIVLRPPFECHLNNKERVIAKYKREDFQETKTPRSLDEKKLVVLTDAKAIADEWATDMRLTHILDAFPQPWDITMTGNVIKAMGEDIIREASGEIEMSKGAMTAINRRTAIMFKGRLKCVQ